MGSNPVEALVFFFFRLLLSNCLNWKSYCDDHTSLSSTTAVQIWIISYMFHIISLHEKIWTRWIDLAPSVWLRGSVGGASHRYRGGHGFESRWSPGFFQASSFQLLKLEKLLRWSHFAFIYNRSTNMNYFIYVSRMGVLFFIVILFSCILYDWTLPFFFLLAFYQVSLNTTTLA